MTPMRFRCCFHLAVTGELEMRSGGKKVKLTLCAWCAFVLQWRKGQDNALMHAGRLTQELAVHFRVNAIYHEVPQGLHVLTFTFVIHSFYTRERSLHI